jgi:hypothetical protein
MQMVLPIMMLIDPDILDQMPLEEFMEYLTSDVECTITYIEDALDSVGGSKGGAGSVGAFCFDNPLDGYRETWYDDNKFGVNKHLALMYQQYYGFTPSSAAEKKSARDAMASGDFQKLSKEYIISKYHKKQAQQAPAPAPAPAPKPKKSKKAPAPAPAPTPDLALALAPKPKPKSKKKSGGMMNEDFFMPTLREYPKFPDPREITNQPPVGLGSKSKRKSSILAKKIMGGSFEALKSIRSTFSVGTNQRVREAIIAQGYRVIFDLFGMLPPNNAQPFQSGGVAKAKQAIRLLFFIAAQELGPAVALEHFPMMREFNNADVHNFVVNMNAGNVNQNMINMLNYNPPPPPPGPAG